MVSSVHFISMQTPGKAINLINSIQFVTKNKGLGQAFQMTQLLHLIIFMWIIQHAAIECVDFQIAILTK